MHLLKVNMKHVLKQMQYRFAVLYETLSMVWGFGDACRGKNEIKGVGICKR